MRGDWLSAIIEGERGSSSALWAGVVDNHTTLRGSNGRAGKRSRTCTRYALVFSKFRDICEIGECKSGNMAGWRRANA